MPGRFGIPTAAEGALAVVNGRMNFEGVTFRFPQSTLELTGGLKIGQWQPDFDSNLKSRDLSEVDRLFQNFLAATGGKPEPLGLAGSGQIQGHVAGTWDNPDAAVQISAEEARYANVPFGSIRGAVVGGFLMGISESMVVGYGSSTYRDALAFAILILILLFKPAGLFGKYQPEKV